MNDFDEVLKSIFAPGIMTGYPRSVGPQGEPVRGWFEDAGMNETKGDKS